MKVLMITPTIQPDHPILGFAVTWVRGIGRRVDKLHVQSMNLHLPDGYVEDNISFESLAGSGPKPIRALRAIGRIWSQAAKYDVVFVHMNEKLGILAGVVGRLQHKPVILWYEHKHVGPYLRLAERVVTRIVSASPQGFRLTSKKARAIGHGIDVSTFSPQRMGQETTALRILSLGRISPVKRIHILLQALGNYRAHHVECSIVGGAPDKAGTAYLAELRSMAALTSFHSVQFFGPISHNDTIKYYRNHDLVVNLSQTGSVDKVILEAMATGCMVLTTNEAFQPILPSICFLEDSSPEALACRLASISALSKQEWRTISAALREVVVKDHNIESLTARLCAIFQEVCNE